MNDGYPTGSVMKRWISTSNHQPLSSHPW